MLQMPKVIVEFDGASKGNPEKAGAGAVLRHPDGNLIMRVREGLGTATNNAAEYRALIRGMMTARELDYDSIHVKGESVLVYNQIHGWQPKDEDMARYCTEAGELISQFKEFEMTLVLTADNTDADAEANKAVDLPAARVEKDDSKGSVYCGVIYEGFACFEAVS